MRFGRSIPIFKTTFKKYIISNKTLKNENLLSLVYVLIETQNRNSD